MQIRKINYFEQFNKSEDYYESWNGQNELQAFLEHRQLVRPNVRAIHLILFGLFALLLAIADVIASIFLIDALWLIVFVNVIFIILFIEIVIRFFFILSIKCYQHYAKEETRRRCLCIPSCSEYSIICLKKYPLFFAALKIRKRLFKTCKGTMYLIDKP